MTRRWENRPRESGYDNWSPVYPLSDRRRGVVLFNESPTVLLSSNSSVGECDEEDYLENVESFGVHHYGDVNYKNNFKYSLRKEEEKEFEDNENISKRLLRSPTTITSTTGVLSTSRRRSVAGTSSVDGEGVGGGGGTVGWCDLRRHPARRGTSSGDRGHGGIGIERLLLDSDQDDDEDDEVVEGVGAEGEETVADRLAMSRQSRIIGEREYRDLKDHRDHIIRDPRDRDTSTTGGVAGATVTGAATEQHSTLRRQHRDTDYDYEGLNASAITATATATATSSAPNQVSLFIYLYK